MPTLFKSDGSVYDRIKDGPWSTEPPRGNKWAQAAAIAMVLALVLPATGEALHVSPPFATWATRACVLIFAVALVRSVRFVVEAD